MASIGSEQNVDEQPNGINKTSAGLQPSVINNFNVKPRVKSARSISHDYSKLLSMMYVVVLIVLGFLFPLTEAIRNDWNKSLYNLIFQIYIFTTSVMFILYLQIWVITRSKHKTWNSQNELAKSRTETINQKKLDTVIKYNNSSSALQSHEENPAETEIEEKAESINYRRRKIEATVSNTNFSEAGNNGEAVNVGHNHRKCSDDAVLNMDEVSMEDSGSDKIYKDMSSFGSAFTHTGSSLYLRLGALIFSIGNIIYIGLTIENGSKFTAEPGCDVHEFWWVNFFRLGFLLAQSFLLLKNYNLKIDTNQPFARFGFMHLIATNMCVWLQTIVNEILFEYIELMPKLNITSTTVATTNTTPSHEALSQDLTTGDYYEYNFANDECELYQGLLETASPYLFPFVLEYSLIAMGMLTVLYGSIVHDTNAINRIHHWIQVEVLSRMPDRDIPWVPHPAEVGCTNAEHGHHSIVLLAKSHRGLFLGVVLLAGSFVSVFTYYFLQEQQDLIYLLTDLLLHVSLLIATLVALYSLNKLAYIAKPASVDDVLLMVAMFGTFLFEVAIIMSSAGFLGGGKDGTDGDNQRYIQVLTLISSLVAAIQTFFQVLLIISGMRRYPNKVELVRKMPGRGTITFLLIVNVAVWFERSLHAKKLGRNTEHEFYGLLTAIFHTNVNLPLLLFFRFHSSVCYADIWVIAYTPIHHDHPSSGSTRSKNLFEVCDAGRASVGSTIGGHEREEAASN